MLHPISWPSPISQIVRWLLATIANLSHLEYWLVSIFETTLPGPAEDMLRHRPVQTWGAWFETTSAMAVEGLRQLAWSAYSHPIDAVIVLWWLIEMRLLLATLWAWLAPTLGFRQPSRNRQHRSQRQAAARRMASGHAESRQKNATPPDAPASKPVRKRR